MSATPQLRSRTSSWIPPTSSELYPADFIIDLPRPEAYFGAERVFGREPLDDADDPDPGLDMVRDIPDEDAEPCRASEQDGARHDFDPDLPAVARRGHHVVPRRHGHPRRARADDDHSSMLVHTTHYVAAALHDEGADRATAWTTCATLAASATGRPGLRGAYHAARPAAVEEVASLPLPAWSDVEPDMSSTFSPRVRVVVDNGYSTTASTTAGTTRTGTPSSRRSSPSAAEPCPGVSRSKGLVVSYFTRTSNTYDTLLQMGRWFGYRPGYEDLPRIWMQDGLADDYKFLALVEEEIRQDMRHMERMKVTPRAVRGPGAGPPRTVGDRRPQQDGARRSSSGSPTRASGSRPSSSTRPTPQVIAARSGTAATTSRRGVPRGRTEGREQPGSRRRLGRSRSPGGPGHVPASRLPVPPRPDDDAPRPHGRMDRAVSPGPACGTSSSWAATSSTRPTTGPWSASEQVDVGLADAGAGGQPRPADEPPSLARRTSRR